VDILSKRDTQQQVKQTMLEYIQDEIKRLNRLIDEFLAFAKPLPPKKLPGNVNQIIEKVSTHFMIPEASHKKITIHRQLGQVPPVMLDEHQLYQALLNLLTNAAQAIDKQGDIYLQTDCSGGWLRIRVSDTGAGIPGAEKEKVFDPFYTTHAKGTGLGLSIVKKIVEHHNGQIHISDFSGGGATFTILLPV
jgi:signal transduction histidine kinase